MDRDSNSTKMYVCMLSRSFARLSNSFFSNVHFAFTVTSVCGPDSPKARTDLKSSQKFDRTVLRFARPSLTAEVLLVVWPPVM